MKTYKLQKDSDTTKVFQIIILFLIVVASFYTITTIDLDIPLFIFISIFTLPSIVMFFRSLKELGDTKEYFLDVEIEDDKVIFNKKELFFKDIESFTFHHYQEHGHYYGWIYTIVDGEKEACLYSGEFKGNNYLSEEMLVEIYTTLEKKHTAYKKTYPSQEKKLKTDTELWGMFEMLNVPPKSLYYIYNGNYEANMFLLLVSALVMTLPVFFVNYDAVYFNPYMQEILYNLYFLTDFKEYEAHGADEAVIVWIGFYIVTIDIFLKQKYKLLFFMSYDGDLRRVGQMAVMLTTLFYFIILVAYFDGENIIGFWVISFIIFYLILLTYMEEKKHKIPLFVFTPFFAILFVNVIASVLWTIKALEMQ